jgi:small subunit ribosomal protein S7
MSRKRKAPKKIPIVDPRYKSVIIPKLINSIMYDGKKTVAKKEFYITQVKVTKLVKSMMVQQQWIGWSKNKREE